MNGAQRYALAATTLFDGTHVRPQHGVVVEGSHIAWVGPQNELPRDAPLRVLPDDVWLVPGFIDIQVNGGGDVLFNADPTPATMGRIAAAHRRFGTTGLLPTLISDTRGKMRAALDALQSNTHAGVLGIHLEGPFLSLEKPGVHDPAMLRAPDAQDFELLTSPHKGVRMITLAPECVPGGFIAGLVNAGTRVALGHSMATYAQTKAALAEGLTGFTHLFNAMRPLGSREPGPIAAALETPSAWFGMIVDGVHVDPAMLRLALRGAARPVLVSDAMPPVGGNSSTFSLYGQRVDVCGASCRKVDGTLAGTALDMATAVRNCVQLLGVPLESALRFASTEPARFLGLDRVYGRIAPGCRADMVVLNPDGMRILGTWLAGAWEEAPVVIPDR
jgi:N-acetylglucosamine-6-phosphate deacetylase